MRFYVLLGGPRGLWVVDVSKHMRAREEEPVDGQIGEERSDCNNNSSDSIGKNNNSNESSNNNTTTTNNRSSNNNIKNKSSVDLWPSPTEGPAAKGPAQPSPAAKGPAQLLRPLAPSAPCYQVK